MGAMTVPVRRKATFLVPNKLKTSHTYYYKALCKKRKLAEPASKGQDVVDTSSPKGFHDSSWDLNCWSSPKKKKRVCFRDVNLVEIRILPYTKDDEEYRKPFWVIVAMDRMRFEERICELAGMLGAVLLPNHREKVFENRFLTVLVLFMEGSASWSDEWSDDTPLGLLF